MTHNKITYGVNRHMFPEFIGVSDEDAKRMMREHSDALDAERYKAMVYDEMKVFLDAQPNSRCTRGDISALMDVIYKEVEEDDR